MATYENKPAVGYGPPAYNQPQGIVTSQPASVMQTTVIINQPTGAWSTELCACGEDIKSCCCAFWFGNFYYACIAQRMGENCCVGCSGYPAGCVPGGHLAMRSAFRNRHGIQGDICSDCCIHWCCLPCSMCQLSRQMDHLGYPNGAC
ncbi:cornifelin homolog [Styela clava]